MMATEPATLLATDALTIESARNGRTYRITVSRPLGHEAGPDETWPFNDRPEKWPVVYVPDGNWYAAMVAGMIRPAALCGGISDAIVVGIGYPEVGSVAEAFRESFTRRDADLTPVRDEAEARSMETRHGRPTPNGDSAGFLAFLEHELIPLIERDYHADPARRILAGHSYGGLFALYAVFERPGLFQTLIIGSPTLSYGNRYMFEREAAFATAHTALPAHIYLFAGEYEESLHDTTLTDTLRLAAILQGRKYDGLSLTQQVFADQNHCEVAAPGFQIGLKRALKR
jgi:predicted alpha/beta superfamily hydrolase